MSAKTCLVIVNLVIGKEYVHPTDGSRLSKSEAQRYASAQVTKPEVESCTVVSEVMQVKK